MLGNSIKCYVGTGTNSEYVDCKGGYACQIVTTGGSITAKSCGLTIGLTGKKDGCKKILNVETCTCLTDGCNHAPFIKSSKIIQALCLISLLIGVPQVMKFISE